MLRLVLLGLMTLGLAGQVRAQPALPKMKYNEVQEIAPGVFFRFASISATDKSVPFGGSNNIWVVFEDYVLVFDANFPKEAGDVIEAVKKTTNKPIRYVVDSHHHGDHAYGNAVFAKTGAKIVASTETDRLLRVDGPASFVKEGKGPGGRKDVAASTLKVPDLIFDEKLVFDDGKQRAELHFLGHAHTAGDAFLYLPKHKILCTGDACTNGPFNYMGHSDSKSWIRVLDRAQKLDVEIVCPGHGPLAHKDVLKRQQRLFVDMHAEVKKGIEANRSIDEIIAGIDWPWHLEWTGIPGKERVEVAKRIYDEQTGRVPPVGLLDLKGLEGDSLTKETSGWTKPKKIVVANLMPARILELKRIAPDVLFVPVKTLAEAVKEAGDADAVIGFCSNDLVRDGKKLRWIQLGNTSGDNEFHAEFAKSGLAVTNPTRVLGKDTNDREQVWLLYRENVRRFVAGERLLCVIEKAKKN